MTMLNSSALLIKQEFERRGYTVSTFNNSDLLSISSNMGEFFTFASKLLSQPAVVTNICSDKFLTKQVLQNWRYPTSKFRILSSKSKVSSILKNLKPPYVLKPLDGQEGRGVIININNKAELIDAYSASKENLVLIEEMVAFTKELRVLTIDGKVFAIAQRRPACVIGDGVNTIEKLIDTENTNRITKSIKNHMPRQGYQIKIDDEMRYFLSQKKISLSDVPSQNESVILRANCNLATGGTTEDITFNVHNSIVRTCESLAVRLRANVLGIDIICDSFDKNHEDPKYNIIEVNSAPGFGIHLYVNKGTARNPAPVLVDSFLKMYPEFKLDNNSEAEREY